MDILVKFLIWNSFIVGTEAKTLKLMINNLARVIVNAAV